MHVRVSSRYHDLCDSWRQPLAPRRPCTSQFCSAHRSDTQADMLIYDLLISQWSRCVLIPAAAPRCPRLTILVMSVRDLPEALVERILLCIPAADRCARQPWGSDHAPHLAPPWRRHPISLNACRHWLAPVCTQFEQLVRRTQTKLIIDFRRSPGLLLAGGSTRCCKERERQLLRAALLRGVERREGQLKEVRALHLAPCQPQLQLVELVAALLRGQLRALHIGRAAQPQEVRPDTRTHTSQAKSLPAAWVAWPGKLRARCQRGRYGVQRSALGRQWPTGATPLLASRPAAQHAAAKTAVHQSLELLLECRWVAYHTPLQALRLTHCTTCPPLGALQALERLSLQCCGSPDAPLALPFDILRLKRLRSLGEQPASQPRPLTLERLPLCGAPPWAL